ncbi:MAG: RNA polymerase sigma factor [Acidobacteriaceae bacterium]|nr:RNA polymerase sigma factor [Acidobacteriaceae bacterium]
MAMDPQHFRSLIEQHQRMVFSIALRIAGEYGTAEEVAQDVFLELFRTAQPFEGPDHIRFWLRRVTVHRATDALRRQARQPESEADEWLDELHTPAAVEPDVSVSLAIAARLDELLRALPETMRVPVVLRYQEDMTPEEIAHLLGQPLATVKSHLQRGLKLMRRKAEITMKEYVRHGNA